jgi:hypothetical protein
MPKHKYSVNSYESGAINYIGFPLHDGSEEE